MLKEQLLKESQTIEVAVELDSIFESVELSESVKQNFASVFETTVKKHAIALAESHIAEIADKADSLVEEAIEAKGAEIEQKFIESADKFFEHAVTAWKADNIVAIDRGIKADLFESMMTDLKTVFIENNVVLPEESVDVVAEMELELQEKTTEAGKFFDAMNESKAELQEFKRTRSIEIAVADLTEAQKEKVESLVEGIEYGDKFDDKLGAIVEMAKAAKAPSATNEPGTIVENASVINNTNTATQDPAGLNYVVENATKTEPEVSNKMSRYINASKI